MITEDYVSFETAKLLKEKGFDERICHWYDDEEFLHKNTGVYLCNSAELDERITAPTLQMAMKWLRVKGYQIIVKHTDDNGYFANILTMDNANPVNKLFDGYNVYEEACESAIKYCLENLI